MGDRSSTASTFVFLVTLLGIFAILTNAIPSEFLDPQNLYETQTREEWFPDQDFGYLNYTDSCNLTKGSIQYLYVGDVNVDIHWDVTIPYNCPDNIYFYHAWQVAWWWEKHLFDDMPITLTDLIEHQTEDFANRSYMILTCPCQKTYYTYFIYNSTAYSSWTEAWNGGELECYVGMGWDDAIEKMNAWSLIWSIMTFQAPEVFGTGGAATVMNAVIAIPIWASFAIMGAIIILWFIPLLGGE